MRAIPFPFRVAPGGAIATTTVYAEIVRAQVIDGLMTNLAERIMRPNYGCDVQAALFDPSDELVRRDAAGMLKNRLQQLRPSVPGEVGEVDPRPAEAQLRVHQHRLQAQHVRHRSEAGDTSGFRVHQPQHHAPASAGDPGMSDIGVLVSPRKRRSTRLVLDYTSRDFAAIRAQLVGLAKGFMPEWSDGRGGIGLRHAAIGTIRLHGRHPPFLH